MARPSAHLSSLIALVMLAANVGCGKMAETIVKTVVTDAAVRTVSNSSHDQLRSILDATNAQCPIQMDAFTSLQRIDVIDDTNIEYYYVVNERGSKLVANMNKRLLAEVAIKQMKGNPIAVAVAEQGLKVRHVYQDESGKELLSYVIDKATINGEFNDVGEDQSNPFTGIAESPDDQAEPAIPNSSLDDKQKFEVEGETDVDTDAESNIEDDLLPKNISPEHKDEPNPSPIQLNPFFEA